MRRLNKIKKKDVLSILLSISILIAIGLSSCAQKADFSEAAMTQTMLALDQIIASTQTVMANYVLTSAAQTVAAQIGAIQEPIVAETQAPPIEEPSDTAIPPTQTDIPPVDTATTIPHSTYPGEPGWVSRWFFDTNSSSTASQKKAPGGDDYYKNYFERPFTANEMIYHPDIDIHKAEVSSDSNFFYFTIFPGGLASGTNDLPGFFGVELDTDLDGRGDFLISCGQPNHEDWRMENVVVYGDSNNDVGGYRPSSSDVPSSSNGYDKTLFSISVLNDPDAAWCRKAPGGDLKVNIAVKRSLIGWPEIFTWGTWIFGQQPDPVKFEFNDHITHSDAGSPYTVNSDYPLKALSLLDSTCRETFGFEATTDIPGLCPRPEPTPTNTKVPKTPTFTATTQASPGVVTGQFFWDANKNGIKDSGEDYYIYVNRIIYLRVGTCGSGGSVIASTTGHSFYFSVAPGTYCLSLNENTYVTTSMPIQVNITSGEVKTKDIGYYYYLGK